ncbi:MAG: TIGR00300 family protein [Planctomycetota bacterium]
MFTQSIRLSGHIIDSLILPKVLDLIETAGARYEIKEIDIGRSRHEISRALIDIHLPDGGDPDQLLAQLARHGVETADQAADVTLQPAPADGILPDDFYATSHLDTAVRLEGHWIAVERIEMDCAIAIERRGTGRVHSLSVGVARRDRKPPAAPRALCLPMSDVRKGMPIVCGQHGVKTMPIDLDRQRGEFEFMASSVSTEKPKRLQIISLAKEIRACRRRGQRVLFVGGPAIVHTGAAPLLTRLIQAGWVTALFAGNALAAHDMEQQMFGTSLGVRMDSGKPVEHGHEHHLRTINRVRQAGSIAHAVRRGLIKGGIMHACIKKKIPFVLAGSLRDDGPLPDVITDMLDAQRAMRAVIPEVGVAVMVATTLHSIATGNCLPARVRTVCVDINPAVVTKLADRGTFQALGLVMDSASFLRELCNELNVGRE